MEFTDLELKALQEALDAGQANSFTYHDWDRLLDWASKTRINSDMLENILDHKIAVVLHGKKEIEFKLTDLGRAAVERLIETNQSSKDFYSKLKDSNK